MWTWRCCPAAVPCPAWTWTSPKCWVGGDKPKVKVELSAEDGQPFDQSGKGAFDLDSAKYSG